MFLISVILCHHRRSICLCTYFKSMTLVYLPYSLFCSLHPRKPFKLKYYLKRHNPLMQRREVKLYLHKVKTIQEVLVLVRVHMCVSDPPHRSWLQNQDSGAEREEDQTTDLVSNWTEVSSSFYSSACCISCVCPITLHAALKKSYDFLEWCYCMFWIAKSHTWPADHIWSYSLCCCLKLSVTLFLVTSVFSP